MSNNPVEHWIKIGDNDTPQVLLCNPERTNSNGFGGRGGLLEIHGVISNGKPAFYYYYENGDRTYRFSRNKALEVGVWYYFVIKETGGTAQLYVDGILEDEQDISSSGSLTAPIAQIVQLGQDRSYFDGEIDRLRIWKTVLTQEQIQGNLLPVFDGTESQLVSYWDFDEDSSTTAIDLSRNDNDAFLIRMVAQPVFAWVGSWLFWLTNLLLVPMISSSDRHN
ncbi:LamG domain-containing protein [Hydrocoleum sp. CS-953]|uniref:LamG domain-containing protein n=1 Tax=Microcoleaceae TaxID=1892252 RepID=UPI00143DE69A|nr:LamG domain-containing protein [Hydrocoleum sp. CS-953]